MHTYIVIDMFATCVTQNFPTSRIFTYGFSLYKSEDTHDGSEACKQLMTKYTDS